MIERATGLVSHRFLRCAVQVVNAALVQLAESNELVKPKLRKRPTLLPVPNGRNRDI